LFQFEVYWFFGQEVRGLIETKPVINK